MKNFYTYKHNPVCITRQWSSSTSQQTSPKVWMYIQKSWWEKLLSIFFEVKLIEPSKYLSSPSPKDLSFIFQIIFIKKKKFLKRTRQQLVLLVTIVQGNCSSVSDSLSGTKVEGQIWCLGTTYPSTLLSWRVCQIHGPLRLIPTMTLMISVPKLIRSSQKQWIRNHLSSLAQSWNKLSIARGILILHNILTPNHHFYK